MALLVTAAGNYCYHKTFDVISNCVFDATKSIRTYFYELKSVLINGVKLHSVRRLHRSSLCRCDEAFRYY